MQFYLKNISGSDVLIEDLGIHIPNGQSTTIDKNNIDGYHTPDLESSLTAGTLILSTTDIGNTSGDLSAVDALDALSVTSRFDRDNPHKVTITQTITEDPGTDITVAELEDLSDGGDTTLHIHDSRYYTETELSTSNPTTVNVHWDNITNSPQFGALHWREPVICNIWESGNTTSMNATSSTEGKFWWNTTDDHLYKYLGGIWVDQGAPVINDRIVYRDGIASDDHIYKFDGTDWVDFETPEDNWAIMVDDDGDGNPSQYIYDSNEAPPNWIKIADVDWGDHNSLGGRDAANVHPASSVSYINTTSGLTATQVQAAIDELDIRIDDMGDDLADHIADVDNPHVVTFTQASSADPDTDITALEAETLTNGSNADALHEHNADNIVYDPTGTNLTSTNVQTAINEIVEDAGKRFSGHIYVDQNRVDTYVANGSIAYPYKTIAEATAVATPGTTIIVSEGNFSENIALPNQVSLEGAGIARTYFTGTITTGTASSNLSGFSHQLSSMDINGKTIIQDVYSTSNVNVDSSLQGSNFTIEVATGNALTMSATSTGVLLSDGTIKAVSGRAIDQLGGSLTLDAMKVTNQSTTIPTLNSTGGTFTILQSSITNTGGGASVAANNGATGTNPNFLADVAYYGSFNVGGSPTIVEGTHDLSGTNRIITGTELILRPADQIDFDPTGLLNITSTNVQGALEQLDSAIDTTGDDLQDHIDDKANPHEVTFTQASAADPLTDISATEAETLTDGSNADLLHKHAASNITYVDTVTNLGATNVQEAIEKLDTSFDTLLPKLTSFPTVPAPEGGDLVYRTDMSMLFHYDSSRNTWLSTTEMFLDWGANVGDGKYLNIHGATATQTGYLMPRNGTIVNITAKGASGNLTKGIEIRSNHNNVPLSAFNLTSGSYNNAAVNIQFSAGDYIQAFASSTGTPIRDIVVMATISWRE